jgi:hypothetical protein
MRLALGFLVLAALGATAACGSNVVVGGGGGQNGGGARTGAGASSTTGDTGTCTTIITWYSQCMCGGTAVGGIDLCQTGAACGTNGEVDAGGCLCQQVNVPGPCP